MRGPDDLHALVLLDVKKGSITTHNVVGIGRNCRL
jgi:hypothetical protein